MFSAGARINLGLGLGLVSADFPAAAGGLLGLELLHHI